MMKNDFLKKAVGTLNVAMAIVAIPALVANGTGMIQDPVEDPREPYCLEVKPVSGSTYSGEAIYTDPDGIGHSRGVYSFDLNIEEVNVDRYDENGNYMRTDVVDSITGFSLKTINGKDDLESVFMPDTIAVTHNGKILKRTLTDVEFNYYTPEQGYTEWNTFVNCAALKHVYVAPSAQNVTWHGEDFLKLRNFHFRSEEVPNFNFYDGSNGTINIYVPESLFTYYTDVIQGASYTATVWSEKPLTPVYVNVDIPGTLADAISSNIDNLNEVGWLVVTGTPNEQDLRMMRRLPFLQILDLSATTGLETVVGCNGLKYLREVIFPAGITYIGEEAFRDCSGLDEMTIPASVKEIRNSAFRNSSIRKINLENVEIIKEYAFSDSKVEALDMAKVKSISWNAFWDCTNLQEVNFECIEYIDGNAFWQCGLRKLSLPNSCKDLSNDVFNYNYNLKEVEIGSGLKNVQDWGNGIFQGCPIEKVTIRTLFPTTNSGFNNTPFAEGATLYVPALTLNEYLLADGWACFKNIKPLDEELDDIKIDRTFMLTSDRGIAKGATLSLVQYDNEMDSYGNYGNLTVRRNINAPLNLGKYLQGGRKELGEYWTNDGYKYGNHYYGSTLIPYSEMTADEVELKMTLQTGRWHFISLPFDVKVEDIKVTDETLWVVRKYSGADRAALNEKTWVNMVDGNILKAGEGYIFHCANDNRSEVVFTFNPVKKDVNSKNAEYEGNKLFAKDAVSYELAEYKSEYEHNASWNLTGNTYPAYLNLRAIDFDGPVTVYNGSTYTAYSTEDDDFVFEPFQAFFVQRQDTEDGDKLTINPEGRAHSSEEAAALSISPKKAPAVGNAMSRSLFNIHITGESGADRARVVVNEAAAIAYEKNRDASKFMSTEKDVPQIFVMNDNRRMAIDERPLGNGEIALGAYFGKSGEYTISLDTRNAEGYTVTLIDNKTGISTDLTAADYTFEADAATDQTRFTLVLNGETTAADAVEAAGVKVSVEGNVLSITAPEEIEIEVVAADGKTVASGRTARFEAVLETGVYAVKAADVTKKIMVK